MTDPIKQQRAEFRNHFKQELRELKKTEKETLKRLVAKEPADYADEIKGIFKALAEGQQTIEIGGHTIELEELDRHDLKPLLDLAKKFFQTQPEGVLTMDLVDNLHRMQRKSAPFLQANIEEVLSTLTINNEPPLELDADQGVQDIHQKLKDLKDSIKKNRRYKIIATVISVGSLLLPFALIPLGVLPVLIPLAFLIPLVLVPGLGVADRFKNKIKSANKEHEYWVYALTFSKTKEFENYKNKFIESKFTKVDSMLFLEAAAITHMIANGTDLWGERDILKNRLKAIEENLGSDFKQINDATLNAKAPAN